MKWSSLRFFGSTPIFSFLPLVAVLTLVAPAHDNTIVRVHDRTKAAAPDRHLGRGAYIVREALSYRGVPYRFGGTTRRGIDCSGLILEACQRWGVYLPRTAVEQFYKGKSVAKNDLQPGDLVFFRDTYKNGISHVGIYIGDGKMVHASSRHAGVIVSSFSEPYYQNHYAGARRFNLDRLPPAAAEGDRVTSTDVG